MAKTKFGGFVISEVSRADLQSLGFDTTNVTDEQMERLASKLGDDYCEQLFWSSLDCIACLMDIPKGQDKKVYLLDKNAYTEEQVKEFSEEKLDEMASDDNYEDNEKFIKIDANGYEEIDDVLKGEGFSDTDGYWIVSFGF